MIANQVAGLLASPFTAPLSDFESIQTVTVGSGGASYAEFTSISGTYKHLQIRAIARDTDGATGQGAFWIQCNSDTGFNYSWHRVYGDGSTATAGSVSSTTAILAGINSRSGNASNIFAATTVDILDYSNTNKYKTVRGLSSNETNSLGYSGLHSGLWMNTAAITSIKIFSSSPANWAQYSHFALYGVK